MAQEILFVEDDKILGEMYEYKFSKHGYSAVVLGDAKNALNWLKKNSPDCIVVDILLPGMNGLQFIKNVRKNPKHDNTKIVILTNLTQANINLNSTVRDSLGVSAYFVKSQISPKQLLDNIDLILSAEQTK